MRHRRHLLGEGAEAAAAGGPSRGPGGSSNRASRRAKSSSGQEGGPGVLACAALTVAAASAATAAAVLVRRRQQGSRYVAEDGVLDLSGKGLREAPAAVLTITHLREVNLSNNPIIKFPEPSGAMLGLTTLILSRAGLQELPSSVGLLSPLKHLDLGRNELTSLPDEMGNLVGLETLNVMGNKLSSVPASIGNLTALYRLGLKSNKLTSLPPETGKLQSLKELFLSDNLLVALPAEFGQLKALVKLQLSWNKLRSLPAEMGALQNLELFRVAVNEIGSIPSEFSQMSKLAWFSLAGNPASQRPDTTLPLSTIQETDFASFEEGGEVLGQGASGDVFLSNFNGKKVAVKLFKSEVSSDGKACDEISITDCLDHPHLTKVLGECKEPRALVLRFEEGKPLAEPPNLQSLLRCRWELGLQFSLSWVVRVAHGVASALAYMHSRGICHGDVYAHNILVDSAGNAVLCDYGASYFYTSQGQEIWEPAEVRAFGLFLQDLVDRMPQGDREALKGQAVTSVLRSCLHEQPGSRPGFKAIESRLGNMQA